MSETGFWKIGYCNEKPHFFSPSPIRRESPPFFPFFPPLALTMCMGELPPARGGKRRRFPADEEGGWGMIDVGYMGSEWEQALLDYGGIYKI